MCLYTDLVLSEALVSAFISCMNLPKVLGSFFTQNFTLADFWHKGEPDLLLHDKSSLSHIIVLLHCLVQYSLFSINVRRNFEIRVTDRSSNVFVLNLYCSVCSLMHTEQKKILHTE